MVDKPDVLVVGAGIFGLTVAERLNMVPIYFILLMNESGIT